MTTTANNNILDEVKIYVGTYAKYNNGSIFGKWLTLSDYSDLSEFYDACRELHKDEEDPEFMFQDYETPELLNGKISECGIDEDIFEVAEKLEIFENFTTSEWIDAHNQYCQAQNYEDEIFDFDEDFFNTFFDGKPMEAARAATFGDLNWSHDYIKFNGYGNLESFDDAENIIDKKAIIEAYLDDENLFSF